MSCEIYELLNYASTVCLNKDIHACSTLRLTFRPTHFVKRLWVTRCLGHGSKEVTGSNPQVGAFLHGICCVGFLWILWFSQSNLMY